MAALASTTCDHHPPSPVLTPPARRAPLTPPAARRAQFDAWTTLLFTKVKACQQKHGDTLWPPPESGACDADTIEGVAAGLYAYQLGYWFKKFGASQFFLSSLDAYELNTAGVLTDVSRFLGAGNGLVGSNRNIGMADAPTAVKVRGAMPPNAQKTLGKFYTKHNAALIRLLHNNNKATYSPSLKGLGIQDWITG